MSSAREIALHYVRLHAFVAQTANVAETEVHVLATAYLAAEERIAELSKERDDYLAMCGARDHSLSVQDARIRALEDRLLDMIELHEGHEDQPAVLAAIRTLLSPAKREGAS